MAKTESKGHVSYSHRLLHWFDQNQRTVPWRKDRDPYRIWVSEVMLQQTQVDTVVPYFNRFVERFPSLKKLAAATEEEVLQLWSGLGYYRRARSLHQAAMILSEEGKFPQNANAWKALPGIGAYTAAAIASQAFGERIAVVDGNVERVLARFLGIRTSVRESENKVTVRRQAEALLSSSRPGDSNQALMELGALICRPKKAHCEICPLNLGCQAWQKGLVASIPAPRKRRVREIHHLTAFVVENNGDLLLFRRDARAQTLASFLELPWINEGDSEARVLREKYGGQWTVGEEMGVIRHSVTYRDFKVSLKRATLKSTPPGFKGIRIPREQLLEESLSARLRKSLKLLEENENDG